MSMVNKAENTITNALSRSAERRNLNALNIAGAQSGDPQIEVYELRGAHGSSTLVVNQRQNKYLQAESLVANSKYGAKDAKIQCLKDVSNILGDPNSIEHIGQRLAGVITGLTTSNENTPTARLNIVRSIEDFCSTMHDISSSMTVAKTKLDQKETEALNVVNPLLLRIHKTNIDIGFSGDFGLRNTLRDLVADLSKNIGIKASYNERGQVKIDLLGTTQGSTCLVSNSFYVQLTPSQAGNRFLDLNHYGTTDRIIATPKDSFGGKVAAINDVRVNSIGSIIDKLNKTSLSLATALNKIHASTNSFPVVNSYTSDKAMTLSDSLESLGLASGKVHFAPVANSSDMVRGDDTLPLRSRETELNDIAPNRAEFVTVQDLLDELNSIGESSTIDTAAIGAIPAAPGQPQEYLTRLRLVTNSNLEDNGLGLAIELSSGSKFDTDVQITSITVSNGGTLSPNTSLPSVYTLEAGQTNKIPAPLVIIPGNNAETDTVVTVGILVKGSNGVFEQGTVEFEIGDNTTPLNDRNLCNKRFYGANGTGSVVIAAAEKDGQPMLSARFVDENGHSITNPNQKGYLVIESPGAPGLTIDSDGQNKFSQILQLNNLFSIDEEHPADSIALSKQLALNPDRLGLASSSIVSSLERDVMVGTVQATGTYTLAANANNLDTVTFQSQTGTPIIYTFKTVPVAGTNDVKIGVDEADTISNLVAKLNESTDILISGVMDFEAAGNVMNVTAKYAGLAANAIATATVSAVGVWGSGTLLLGAEEAKAQDMETYAYSTGDRSPNLFVESASEIMSLFSANFLHEVIIQYKNAEAEAASAEKTAAWANKKYEESTVADKDLATAKAYEELSFFRTQCAALEIMNQAEEAFLRAVT